jgi:two-component system phosphate regulon response regulator OmpR
MDQHNSKFQIAIVEDHKALREVFVDNLQSQGYLVFGASSAEDLDEFYVSQPVHLLILDINLPGEDGISIAKRYRKANPNISVIMLTVKATANDRIAGYDAGADIYLPKPVSAHELGAAVGSIARRVLKHVSDQGHPSLSFSKRIITKDLTKVSLSEIEAKLLKGLINAPHSSLEYWQLLELIDREVTDKDKANLGVYIHRLCKKLEQVGMPDPAIKSIWKKGYQLTSSFSQQD